MPSLTIVLAVMPPPAIWSVLVASVERLPLKELEPVRASVPPAVEAIEPVPETAAARVCVPVVA